MVSIIKQTIKFFKNFFIKLGAASSWIASTGFYIGTTGSFLELSIASLLGAIACWLIPYDTTGVELDKDL